MSLARIDHRGKKLPCTPHPGTQEQRAFSFWRRTRLLTRTSSVLRASGEEKQDWYDQLQLAIVVVAVVLHSVRRLMPSIKKSSRAGRDVRRIKIWDDVVS